MRFLLCCKDIFSIYDGEFGYVCQEDNKKNSDEESDAVEAEHLHHEGVDYGLLSNGDLYTQDGEYAGKWDAKKKRIMEEIFRLHLLLNEQNEEME